MGKPFVGSVRVVLATVLLFAGVDSLRAESWFVALKHEMVAPTPRSNVSQLYDAGTVETDGFKDLVISFGGEFKQGLPESGAVGAILIPDHEIAEYLLRNEGVFVFPTEVRYEVGTDLQGAFFMSEPQEVRVAFPRYRVYLYNETHSGASMSVFVYRSR